MKTQEKTVTKKIGKYEVSLQPWARTFEASPENGKPPFQGTAIDAEDYLENITEGPALVTDRTMPKYLERGIREAFLVEELRRDLRERVDRAGRVVFTRIQHVSRSGMRRVISPMVFIADQKGPNNPVHALYLGRHVARVLGFAYDEHHEGIIMDGCGMDMSWSLVNHLEKALYPEERDRPNRPSGYRPEVLRKRDLL